MNGLRYARRYSCKTCLLRSKLSESKVSSIPFCKLATFPSAFCRRISLPDSPLTSSPFPTYISANMPDTNMPLLTLVSQPLLGRQVLITGIAGERRTCSHWTNIPKGFRFSLFMVLVQKDKHSKLQQTNLKLFRLQPVVGHTHSQQCPEKFQRDLVMLFGFSHPGFSRRYYKWSPPFGCKKFFVLSLQKKFFLFQFR